MNNLGLEQEPEPIFENGQSRSRIPDQDKPPVNSNTKGSGQCPEGLIDNLQKNDPLKKCRKSFKLKLF